jgi:hypothetical protein
MVDPTQFGDFPKADPVERGCGDREPGGVYAECGLSSHGYPLEDFLIDPPLSIPDGLDLVNKPQTWQRMSPMGESVLDGQGQPIYDLVIWVGAEYYEYMPDFLEEVRRYGASRRLNPNLDLSLLSTASRMILAHPKVINTAWQKQRPPRECGKHVLGHGLSDARAEVEVDEVEWDEEERNEEDGEDEPGAIVQLLRQAAPDMRAASSGQRQEAIEPAHCGPCLFKTAELIPQEAAETMITLEGEDGPLCLRRIGSTTYSYRPTGEAEDGLIPGLFAALPITGFALIQFADGSVNEKAKQKLLHGVETHGKRALPFYESAR